VTNIVQQVVAGSFIYRWLTAEPEPEVIVIDLRETWTVGPMITIIDRVLKGFIQSAQTSTVVSNTSSVATVFRDRPLNVASLILITGILSVLLIGVMMQTLSVVSTVVLVLLALIGMFGLGSKTTLKELVETKPAQILISAFEPPDPPSAPQSETHETGTDKTEPNSADDH